MDPQQLQIILGQLAQALGLPPPPLLAPDQIASTRSVISQLLAALGMAGNAGDPADMAAAEAGLAERELQTGAALAKFPANEEQAAQAMGQVMGMAQQIPQSLSGVGQGVNGVFSGLVQQLSQAMQQGVQAGGQLIGGLGNAGETAEAAGELPEDALGAGGALLGTGAGVGMGLGSTMPAGNLGPPATPSAATFPASSSGPVLPPGTPEPVGAGRGAMGGYPMMPPGAAGGATGATGDAKADTKRVVPPAVKNGAPVQGRISTPPKLPEVTKHVQGKPVATRRIVAPERKTESDGDGLS
jgi:hypothetical protein